MSGLWPFRLAGTVWRVEGLKGKIKDMERVLSVSSAHKRINRTLLIISHCMCIQSFTWNRKRHKHYHCVHLRVHLFFFTFVLFLSFLLIFRLLWEGDMAIQVRAVCRSVMHLFICLDLQNMNVSGFLSNKRIDE